ncbi:MAG: DUF4167 domain-containing protein [Rubrimonas sp.]|uniref:DUF4167 domain-containing protein n=1 Tax=Rubrimonas sp. TaxID=2036015 RepID=UPI002FDCE260
MRPSQKNRSGRNKSGRKPMGNVVNRVFESAGPEGKVRGTPQQIIDKYLLLARDAQTSSDRVAAENFLQHAEHYIRMLNAAIEQGEERGRQFGGAQRDQDDAYEDEDDRDGDPRGQEPRAQDQRAHEQRPFEARGGDQRGPDHRSGDHRPNDQRQNDQRHSDQRRRDDQRPPRGPDFAPRREAQAGGLETIDPSDDDLGDAPALVPTPEDHADRRPPAEPAEQPVASAASDPAAQNGAEPGAVAAPAAEPAEPAPKRAPRRRARRAPDAAPEGTADGPPDEAPQGALGDAQAPSV